MVGLALALCRRLPCNPWASYQPVCTQADQKAQEAQPAQRELRDGDKHRSPTVHWENYCPGIIRLI